MSSESQDRINAYNNQQAQKWVDSLPAELRSEMGALARIERGIHLGVDAFGKRIPPEAREILKRTRTEIKANMALKYSGGDLNDLNSMLAARGLANETVRQLLADES